MSVTGLEAEQDASRGHTAQPNTGHSVEVPEPVQVTGELFQQELCQLPTLESSQEPIHLSPDRCSLGRAIQDGRGHIGLQGGMALGDLIQCHFSSAPQRQQLAISVHTGFTSWGTKLHLLLPVPWYYSLLTPSSPTSSYRPGPFCWLLKPRRTHTHTYWGTVTMWSMIHTRPWLEGCAHACSVGDVFS